MRIYAGLIVLVACSSPAMPAAKAPNVPPPAPPPSAAPAAVEAAPDLMREDTPKTTVAGNMFIAPAGWSVRVRESGTILEAPEPGSFVALYDLADVASADAAAAKAWTLYTGKTPYTQISVTTGADTDGWTQIHAYEYDVPPNLKRRVHAEVMFANNTWTALILDMSQAVAEKRYGQTALMLGKLLPKGGARESFAGKQANTLDAARIATLQKFVSDAEQLSGVPGVSFGLIQNGKVAWSGGIGVRQLGKPAKVDGDTKFLVASNTKALATLMLAKLVDAGKITWDTPASTLLPSFKLGDADTTSKVQVKHLICACTGMPRQDFEWVFEWAHSTPATAIERLGSMQPTSKFGELFQYSNPMAAAAGYIGGHVAYPSLELGAAFDKAMQTLVFTPLQMNATTFDFAQAQRGNAAVPHAFDAQGKVALALAKVNSSIVPLRPAGAAWSSVNDMLKYVQMELAEGTVAGKPYIGKEALLARRASQVRMSTDATYGMGLVVDTTWGVPVVHHGGSMIGFYSDMMWLPEHGVGAVILTNGDPGWVIRAQFQRKLLEVLFDGKPEADAKLDANVKAYFAELEAARKLRTVPADPQLAGKLLAKYTNPALGEITVKKEGAALVFDFGEYASEVASRTNPDGTVSFITVAPGVDGLEFVLGESSLTTRDNQHEYVFTGA